MNFNYDYYQLGCLTLPIITLIGFAFTACLFVIYPIIKFFKNRKFNARDIIAGIFFLAVAIPLLNLDIGQLVSGGIYLLREKEKDAIVLQGEISEIKELANYEFPNPRSYHESNGVQFTVNGVECAAPIKGSLEVGNTVEVVYLPKSGYILSIHEIEPPIEP